MKKTAKSIKVVKAKKVRSSSPSFLDRKQASRLGRNAYAFTHIKESKRVLLNGEPSSKTEAISKLLVAILDDMPFKVETKLDPEVFRITI